MNWEEEVRLNTGERITVKRSGTYTLKSAPGNPLDYGWGQDWRSTIEFTYKGRTYRHTDEIGLILLAIGPNGIPSLVASPNSEWNSKHRFDNCVVPYYVQLRPDSSGEVWTWPERIEPWLYRLPTNLMFGLPPLKSGVQRFTPADRERANAKALQDEHSRRIDPTYAYENICSGKK